VPGRRLWAPGIDDCCSWSLPCRAGLAALVVLVLVLVSPRHGAGPVTRRARGDRKIAGLQPADGGREVLGCCFLRFYAEAVLPGA
jgi:hypothetical protein